MTSPARVNRQPLRRPETAPGRARRPDLHLVGDRPRRIRTAPFVAAAVVIAFGAVLAAAVLHSVLVGGQAELDRLDAQVRAEREALQHDRLALADAQSPGRIAVEAASLGMVPSEEQRWISPSEGADPTVTGATAGDDGTDGTDGTEPADQTEPTDRSSPVDGGELAGAPVGARP